MEVVGRFLKVQWRVAVDWPDFGFGGHRGGVSRAATGAPDALDLRDWLRVLDDVADTCERYPQPGRMHFYVGPRASTPSVLRPMLEHARERGLELYLLGRSDFIDEPTVAELERLDVALFNIFFRPLEAGPAGDERERAAAERAIALLQRSTVPFRLRFVVHDWNRQELGRVLEFVERHELPRFDLMRGVPCRRPDGGREAITDPREFRELLVTTRRTFAQWKAEGRVPKLAAQRGEHLWWLLDWENGRLDGKKVNRHAIHCCSVGRNLLAIGPDGTVWPCRRLPLPIGKLPEQSVDEVLSSPALAALARTRPSCVGCPVLERCGGCLAIAQAASGDPLGPDPQCWWSPARPGDESGEPR